MVSDLTRMEALAGPLKTNNRTVEASFHTFFARPDVRVVPIEKGVAAWFAAAALVLLLVASLTSMLRTGRVVWT